MMATRKKGAVKRASGGGHAFAVVVEQLRGDFRVFGEALGGLRAHVVQLGADMVQLRAEMVRRFDLVDRRFEQVDRRFDRVECDVSLLKTATMDSRREIKAIHAALGGR